MSGNDLSGYPPATSRTPDRPSGRGPAMPTLRPVSASFDFSGRVAVVTGGTKGIGQEIATTVLAAGAHVVVCGRSTPPSLPAADVVPRSMATAAIVRGWPGRRRI